METANPQPETRTYRVRTFGCQMNVHDSERLQAYGFMSLGPQRTLAIAKA
ncbi:hypothetical protein [Geodermatophilus sp. URMC 64]